MNLPEKFRFERTITRRRKFGRFRCHLGHITISYVRWSGSSSLALSWTSIKWMNWQACIGMPIHSTCLCFSRLADWVSFLGLRYLQHLAHTRFQHVERIRLFTLRAFERISKPSAEESSSFERSFSFLDLALVEASAIQTFAEGLSYVSVLRYCLCCHGVSDFCNERY